MRTENLKAEIIEKLLNYEKELRGKTDKFQGIVEKYLRKVEEFEKLKLNVIDPTKRDSVEKQLMAAMQNDETLRDLFLEVEQLRRERDILYREIDTLKTLISINQSILSEL